MCTFNVHIFDTYAESYDGRHPQKILSQHERLKIGKYIKDFLEQQCHYIPLVLSVDEVMVKDKKAVTNNLHDALSNK